MRTLTSKDIEVISRLCGAGLASSLREYLLGFYGKGGVLERYWEAQQAYLGACKNHGKGLCGGCGNCVPFCEDELWRQLFTILLFWECGHFNPATDNYETIQRKLNIEIVGYHSKDTDIPF